MRREGTNHVERLALLPLLADLSLAWNFLRDGAVDLFVVYVRGSAIGEREAGREDGPFVRWVPTPNEHPIPASSEAFLSAIQRSTSSASEKTISSARSSAPRSSSS